MNNITMGQYLPTDSPVHRLDPRSKLICTTMVIFAVLMTFNLLGLLPVTFLTMLVVLLSGIKPNVYWQSLKILWLLLIIGFVLQVFFTPGNTLLTVGFIKISREGLLFGGWLLWRISILLLVAAVLTFTTTPLQLTMALEWLLSPLRRLRVPVQELAMMINLAMRFVPTLFDEAGMLLLAQRSRGADFNSGSIRERVSRLTPFLVPLLMNIFSRADEIALAMEIRCYQVGAVRSRLHEMRFNPADYAALLLTAAILAVVVVVKVLY